MDAFNYTTTSISPDCPPNINELASQLPLAITPKKTIAPKKPVAPKKPAPTATSPDPGERKSESGNRKRKKGKKHKGSRHRSFS